MECQTNKVLAADCWGQAFATVLFAGKIVPAAPCRPVGTAGTMVPGCPRPGPKNGESGRPMKILGN